jgi:hypothetical protein
MKKIFIIPTLLLATCSSFAVSGCTFITGSSSTSWANYYERMASEAYTIVSNFEVGFYPASTNIGYASEIIEVKSGLNEAYLKDHSDSIFSLKITLQVVCAEKLAYSSTQTDENYQKSLYTVGQPDYIDTPNGYGQWSFGESNRFEIPTSAFPSSGEVRILAQLLKPDGTVAEHGESIQRIGFTINPTQLDTWDYCTPFYFGSVESSLLK